MPDFTRWLIGTADEGLPERLYLHVFDDGEAEAEMDWRADRAGALRFGSREAAERFAALHRLGTVEISDHPAPALARLEPHTFDRVAVA